MPYCRAVHGAGRGTRYSIAATDLVKHDLAIVLTNNDRMKEFSLLQLGAFLRIMKIILTPKFEWKHSDQWSTKLSRNGLYLTVHAATSKGSVFRQPYSVFGFSDPSYFQAVFIVNPNIVVPYLPGKIGRASCRERV